MSTEPYIVYVIADYGQVSDLAFAEVSQKIHNCFGSIPFSLHEYAVPAFDTIATGFTLAQLAMNSKLGEKQLFFVNTAPRKDKKEARINNEGEGLVYAKLKNGVRIVAVNSGYSLSFIKPLAEEIRVVHVSNDGTQFRSRDIYPDVLGHVAHGTVEDILGDDVSHTVPDRVPENSVCYTDGYGNLKCMVDHRTLQGLAGKDMTVEINGHERLIRVGSGIFDVADGQFCFARGSSGWTLPDGTEVQFWEVVLRGGNAAKQFSFPSGGAEIKWR